MPALAEDLLLQKIKELHLLAFQLRETMADDADQSILLAALRPYEALAEELQKALPAEIISDNFSRHTKWTGIRIRQYKMNDCRGDVRDLCYTDIPALETAYLRYWQSSVQQPAWESIHPLVRQVAQSRFTTGHFADSVEAVFKEINDLVKQKYKLLSGKEKDGDALMREVFTCTPNNQHVPHLRLTDRDLTTESGRNVQNGYLSIFAGAMQGIRNPKAHANITIDSVEAWEMITLGSHLMRMWDRGQ